ncbi:hypothetical protein Tco_1397331 [Tanacetum coccineum]
MAGVLPSSSISPLIHKHFLTNPKLYSSSPSSITTRNRTGTCFAKKGKPGFFDVILDYIEGGPKLRKWYGAPGLNTEDESILEETNESLEENEARDAVLVTDGDNEIGQTIILSLIIKRIRVKALVKDRRAAMESFGTYVETQKIPHF